MLIVSVVVVALIASAYVFVPDFQDGVASLAQDVSVALATGQVGGIGFARGSGGSSDSPEGGNDNSTLAGGSNDSASTGGPNGSSSSGPGGRLAVGGASFDRNSVTGDAGPLGNPPGLNGLAGRTAAVSGARTMAPSNPGDPGWSGRDSNQGNGFGPGGAAASGSGMSQGAMGGGG